MIFNIFLSTILFLILIYLIVQFLNIVFYKHAPLFSTDKKFINKIIMDLKIKDNDNIYELGCGYAKFLSIAEKKYPNAKYIGIEYSFITYIFTKIKLYLKNSRAKIINKDFLKIDISNANTIYCYLIPDIMEKLSNKIRNECKGGTLIISYRFSLPNITLEKTVNFGNNKFYFHRL